MHIAVAVFDGVEELDFVGPYEVLAAWAHHFPDDDVRIRIARLHSVERAKQVRRAIQYDPPPPV